MTTSTVASSASVTLGNRSKPKARNCPCSNVPHFHERPHSDESTTSPLVVSVLYDAAVTSCPGLEAPGDVQPAISTITLVRSANHLSMTHGSPLSRRLQSASPTADPTLPSGRTSTREGLTI